MLLTRDQAVVAAEFKIRGKVTNRKALQNLGVWGAQCGIFSAGEDMEDEWARQDAQNATDRTQDPVQTYSDFQRQLEDQKRVEAIEEKTRSFLTIHPQVAIQRRIKAANTRDRASIDFQDPADYRRTPLMKAVLDNNLHEVRRCVESLNANLWLMDADGYTALGLAYHEGHMAIAVYLDDAQRKAQPDPISNVSSA